MSLKISFIPLLIYIFTAFDTNATSMHGSIVGNSEVIWNTAVPVPEVANGIAPSYWDAKEPLATSEWYPGSLKGGATTRVTFIEQSTGDSFSTDLEWKGVQYNMGSSSSLFNQSVTSSNVGNGIAHSSCSIALINNPISTAVQNGGLCASSKGFKSMGSRVTPFKFYRPVVSLTNVVSDIKGNPSGRYSAFVQYNPVYFYTSESGVLTYALTTQSLYISLDYTAAFLLDAQKFGDGVIDAKYNKDTQQITGSTEYQVNVDGLFPDGVKMTFNDIPYVLTSTNSGDVIPFNVSCMSGCDTNKIVNDGVLSILDGEVVTNQTTNVEGGINILLDIDYEVSADEVSSGAYNGGFSVKFEANL